MSPLVFRALGATAITIALVALVWLAVDRFHQKELADAAARCATAAQSAEDSAPLTDCLTPVRSEIATSRQARVCERSLLPALRPETRFAMAQACGEGVKRLVAASDALASSNAALSQQLSEARADLGGAIERAERRSANSQEREANGRKIIARAPRDAGGSIRCDADCLRKLGQ